NWVPAAAFDVPDSEIGPDVVIPALETRLKPVLEAPVPARLNDPPPLLASVSVPLTSIPTPLEVAVPVASTEPDVAVMVLLPTGYRPARLVTLLLGVRWSPSPRELVIVAPDSRARPWPWPLVPPRPFKVIAPEVESAALEPRWMPLPKMTEGA